MARTAPAQETDTRSRIVDAALELFYERGYHGTSVRDVTVACGLTPGALYNYFPSKDALLHAVIAAGQAELDDEIARVVGDRDHDHATLLWLLTYAATRYNAVSNHFARVANEEYRFLAEPERSGIIEIRRAVRDRFATALDDGVKRGVFSIPPASGRTRDDIKLTAMTILNLIIGVARWFDPSGSLSAETVAEQHADLVLRMVGAERPAGLTSPDAKRRARR